MPDTFNLLISSAGRRVVLIDLFRRALAQMNLQGQVFASELSAAASGYHAADRGLLVPRADSPEFIPATLRLCAEHAIKLIVPTKDFELPRYAAHRAEFEARGTTVLISDPETVAIAGDKRRTHAWLEARGLPTVRQTTVVEALDDPEGWPLPLVVKPAVGDGSRGVATVRSRAELGLRAGDGAYVAQTLARGHEHTVDVLLDGRGGFVCAVPRRRLEVRAGEISKGVTVRDEAMERLVRRLCAALPGARGPLCVQLFRDPTDGALQLIEVNPRFGGGFPLSLEAGADFPRWIIEELLGRPSSAAPDRWRAGLVMLRYDDAVFVEEAEAGI